MHFSYNREMRYADKDCREHSKTRVDYYSSSKLIDNSFYFEYSILSISEYSRHPYSFLSSNLAVIYGTAFDSMVISCFFVIIFVGK